VSGLNRDYADVLYLSWRLSVGPIAQHPRGLGQSIGAMWSRVMGRGSFISASYCTMQASCILP
jgi:hypothetical protein